MWNKIENILIVNRQNLRLFLTRMSALGEEGALLVQVKRGSDKTAEGRNYFGPYDMSWLEDRIRLP